MKLRYIHQRFSRSRLPGLVALAAAASCTASASTLITDPRDLGDSSGDIRKIGASVHGDYLFLTMTVDGVAAPSMEQTPAEKVNQYYYHWLVDTDNNPATGRGNAKYEGTPNRRHQTHRRRAGDYDRLA